MTNKTTMPAPLLTELPYRADSAALFEAIADLPWAVFIDSGRHHPGQSRYDIISAQPYIRLVTRGQMTEVHADGVLLSRDDPFELVRRRFHRTVTSLRQNITFIK